MSTPVRASFEPKVIMLKTAALVPSREIDSRTQKDPKYRQIEASVRQIGLVEPIIVFPIAKGQYRVLDGHKRLDIMTRRGVNEVQCILATEDESFTYNKRVNYLTPVGENQMILKALKHNSEATIAKALAVNTRTIQRKRDLLMGICKEAIDLLKDRRIPVRAFAVLRRMKPVRQVEVVQLMISSQKYSEGFAQALLAGTRAEMLAEPGESRAVKAIPKEQRIGMEHETEMLLRDFREAESSYGANLLT